MILTVLIASTIDSIGFYNGNRKVKLSIYNKIVKNPTVGCSNLLKNTFLNSLMNYFFDMFKVMTDMLYSMIKPMWLAIKKIYDKLIEAFKKAMQTIRNLPQILKDILKVQIEMISNGIDMFVRTMESFMNTIASAFSKLADIPKEFFTTANMAMDLGLAMFMKGMDIPQKMLEMSITATNKI